jgi:hypothetical protein
MDIPLSSYISCIMARLAYFDDTQFLNKYLQIFNIPDLNKQLININHSNIQNIFEFKIQNMIKINKRINEINYTTHPTNLSSENVQYISICTSNYSGIYVVANKLMDTIFVCFRGTYSVKSGLSYSKLSSIKPQTVCKDSDDGYLLGVFKIIAEVFYTIEESINYLSQHFLKKTTIKIITTGHSLGGAAACIFSYLWINHEKNKHFKIGCITFGSPRVMNGSLIKKYNDLIHKNIIMFKRYITNGDPFAKLPITSKKLENSYYFPDDYDDSLSSIAITCSHTQKTKKVLCKQKNKTKKHKINVKYHGIYLGIIYKGAAGNKMDLNKEIKRDSNDNTICRIIICSNNNYKAVFFNLNDAKRKPQGWINEKIRTIKKKIISDYKHQDIYINKQMFEKLIENSEKLIDNLNPLSTEKYVEIQHKSKKNELICI